MRDQAGDTFGAAKRLVGAHVDLAKAEFSEIVDEVKRVAVLGGIAVAVVVFAGLLVSIGTCLFVGEWLFGSLGWGVLQGALLLVGIAVAALLLALGVNGATIGRRLFLAIVIGVVVGVVFGLDLSNLAWTRIGEQAATNISADVRPLVVGTAVVAVVLAIVGLLLGARGGGMGGAIAGLVGGAIVGAALGAFSAITFGPRVGAALGVTVALLAWPVLMGIAVARQGIDTEALKARFIRTETIDTTKETIEWVRAQTPLGRKS